MAALDGTQKADVYETLSSLNMAFAGIIQHLQNKRQSCSQVLLLNCKPNLTRNFWKTCTSLTLVAPLALKLVRLLAESSLPGACATKN
jgi:hypothetical protein